MSVIWKRFLCGLLASLVVLVAGCTTTPQTHEESELPTISDRTVEQKRAAIHLQLAIGYYERKQQDVALDEIKQALNIYSDYADAYGMRAVIYVDMGELSLAQDNFDRALRLEPNNPVIANNYGRLLCQTGRVTKALEYFESAVKNKSYRTPSKALLNAGVCSLRLNNHKVAEQYFSSAFKYDPSNPLTNGFLARIYYDQEDYSRARFYINRVIQANVLKADVLWLAIKISHKLGDRISEEIHMAQLQRLHSGSKEYVAAQRRAFDE